MAGQKDVHYALFLLMNGEKNGMIFRMVEKFSSVISERSVDTEEPY